MAWYCSGCGVALPPGARFCSACGKAVIEPLAEPGSSASLLLIRPLAGRKLAGVCQGLANRYYWDVTLVRVIAILLAVAVFPVGLVAYFIFWVVVPEEPRPASAITNLKTTT